jgi:hypothetical protein
MVSVVVGILALAAWYHQPRSNSPPGGNTTVTSVDPAPVVFQVKPAVYFTEVPVSMKYGVIDRDRGPGESPPGIVIQPVLYLEKETAGLDGHAAGRPNITRATRAQVAAIIVQTKDGAHSARSGPIRL